MDDYPRHIHALANLYDLWEFFWPANVTIAQLHGAANDG